jgi:hypothetical protein
MKLSAPKKITWFVSLALGVIALLIQLDILKGFSTYGIWLALVSAAILLIATTVKGL